MQGKADKVLDYMIPLYHYSTLHKNATFEEAVNMMNESAKEKGYRWVLVLDDNGKIVGILTMRNVYNALGSLASRAGGWLGMSYNNAGLFFWDGLKLMKDTPVTKFIRPVVDAFVFENDPPAKAVEIIIKRKITIVPVLDSNLKVVGIVRPVDLLPFIIKLFETNIA
ncbi:MAG: CBS domain-containing protein [Actinobacteria bacterium]|nr:CBS domain-containing protein [Actinomycetota bacterium]